MFIFNQKYCDEYVHLGYCAALFSKFNIKIISPLQLS